MFFFGGSFTCFAYKRPARVCTWIGSFEIAHLIDRLDLPQGSTAKFVAAFTGEQLHHHGTFANDGDRGAYQTLLREQSIHQHGFLPGSTQGGHQQVHLALVCLL